MIALKPHQEEAAAFLRKRRYAILADPPRLGKTYPTAAVALEQLAQHGGHILVVAPAGAKFVWRDAFVGLGYTGPCLIVKTQRDASAALEKGHIGIVVVPWGLLKLWPVQKATTLILDEAHRCQSATAQRTKAALKLMATARSVYALSGTVMLNRPINLWPILFGLKITKMGWYDFAHHFCKAWTAPWGLDVSGASNLPELKALINPHLLRRTKAQVFPGYVAPEFRLVTFDRPKDKRETKFNADALAELANPILSIEGLSEILHEAALQKVPDAVDFISGLLDSETDMKLVVFAYHTDVIAALAAGLKRYRPVTITGATSPALRETRRKIFMTRVECRLVIANIVACSEAIDFSASDTVVFIETTWSPALLEQAAARVENINKPSCAALAYLLTIEASLDHYILTRILQKMQVINQVVPLKSVPRSPSSPSSLNPSTVRK